MNPKNGQITLRPFFHKSPSCPQTEPVTTIVQSKHDMNSSRKFLQLALTFCVGVAVLTATTAAAQQGARRMLYTVPNTTFIENPAGDSVVTINDTSGSIATLQASIDN